MPLNIPTRNLNTWASELITACQVSMKSRQERGAYYRNIYLTGHADGMPQTYKKTYAYIKTRSSLLYSPTELRFMVSPYGPSGPRERAMGRSAAATLHEYIRAGSVDTAIEDAVEWSLVKGKTFIQLEWDRGGLRPYMVQPETMGVLRDDLPSLDRQDAFVHSSWFTEARFAMLIDGHPNKETILRQIKSLSSTDEDKPETTDNARQVIIGGQLYPYRASGTRGAGMGKGLVNWLQAPAPMMDAKTQATLIRLDELWVWDRKRDDWTTFQLVGTVLIEPTVQHRNLFAEGEVSGDNGKRPRRGVPANDRNPLSGHTGFIEICANPIPDYFWGMSEIFNVAVIQEAINNRVDGINRLLRRQEDPSWLIAGLTAPANRVTTALKKPGGWWVEGQGAGLKVEKMTPDLPQGLWQSLHELEDIFDSMAGMPPVMKGQGEEGVRAQAHAETLVRLAGARLKDDAIGIERQVEEVGGLGLDMLRAHLPDNLPYYIKQSEVGPFAGMELDPLIYEPPATGMVALPFYMYQLDDRYKVTVDSHSSSPAFSNEAERKAQILSQRGATDPVDLIRLIKPPHEEELVANYESAQAAKAEFYKQHPELLQKPGSRRH